jgi:hypothetical protein
MKCLWVEDKTLMLSMLFEMACSEATLRRAAVICRNASVFYFSYKSGKYLATKRHSKLSNKLEGSA